MEEKEEERMKWWKKIGRWMQRGRRDERIKTEREDEAAEQTMEREGGERMKMERKDEDRGRGEEDGGREDEDEKKR